MGRHSRTGLHYHITAAVRQRSQSTPTLGSNASRSENHWLRKFWEQWRITISANGGPTEIFVVLDSATHPGDVEQQLQSLVSRNAGDNVQGQFRYHLQPLLRAHLYAVQDFGHSSTKGDVRRLYVLATLALFVLVIAVVNSINLATARSTLRSREVGTCKVAGARPRQIVGQFLGESILFSTFAHVLALAIVWSSLSWVSSWLGIALSVEHTDLWLLTPGSVLMVGLLAGAYPSLFISTLRPITALRGESAKGKSTQGIRRGLVFLQFSLSALLLVFTWVTWSQWRYMVEKDLGFEKEDVVVLPIFKGDPSLSRKRHQIRERFLAHPRVRYATMMNNAPFLGGSATVRPEGEVGNTKVSVYCLDEDLLDVLGIELLLGRDFSDVVELRREERSILNETAARALGWDDPVGKRLHLNRQKTPGTVIGVARDFHHDSLHRNIRPLVMRHQGTAVFLCLRIDSEDLPKTMEFLESTWEELNPNRPFDYYFPDQNLESDYRADRMAGKMFSAAAGLAILIGSLGLVGLISFSTELRIKEIGVRKALGATWIGIIALFCGDLFRLVILANLLMLPVSVYLSRTWLSDYPYRVALGPWPYLFAAGLSLAIAGLTVGLTAYQPARKDPVIALRQE